jgi:hypothetical protein
VALAWLPELELDEVEVALTEEPTLPLALALALPPETDVVVITIVEEPPLAVAVLDTVEPAIALPAPSARPSNRQGDSKLNKTFIDTSQFHQFLMIAEMAAPESHGRPVRRSRYWHRPKRRPIRLTLVRRLACG